MSGRQDPLPYWWFFDIWAISVLSTKLSSASMCASYSLLSLLSGLLSLVLCQRLWSTWILILCRLTNTDVFGFFYIEKTSLNHYIWYFVFQFGFLHQKKWGVSKRMDLCLGLQFNSIYQCVCFYANIMQVLLLQLCTTAWNQGQWYLWQFFYFCVLF